MIVVFACMLILLAGGVAGYVVGRVDEWGRHRIWCLCGVCRDWRIESRVKEPPRGAAKTPDSTRAQILDRTRDRGA